ncbi:hypothetical protein ACMAZD_25900 (plasmid) [Vibrio sp. nBUS_14]|uniref:hypothetical protein n=1 Tax=Vibrio sp. nBUS_14 TaxID=3395321 RepID=UPI003EB9D8D2
MVYASGDSELITGLVNDPSLSSLLQGSDIGGGQLLYNPSSLLTSTPAFGSNIIEIGVGAASLGIAALAISSNGSSNQDTTNRDATNRDATVPTIATLEVSSDNVVNLEDDVAAVTFSGTTTGVEDGQTVTLDIGGIQATAVVSSDAFSGTADLSSLADGTTLPVHVDVMDVAGNAAPTFSGSIDKDTSAPSINSLVVSTDDVVNLEDDVAAVAFSGTTTGVEDGQTVTVNIAGQSVLVAVSDNAFSGTVDLTGVSDGAALAVQADVSDASGNAAPTFSVSIDKDTSAPSINSLVVSTDDVVNLEDDVAAVAFSGTTTGVEDGQTVTLDIAGQSVLVAVNDNAFSGTADLSSLADGTTLPVQVDVMDVAGNAAPTFNSTISKDTSAPSINSFVVSIDDVVNLEDDAAAVAFSGTTTGVEDGQTVTLDIAGQSVLVTVSDNAFSGTVDLSRVNGSGLRIIGEVKDVAGNAAPVFTHYFDKDTVAPTIATLEVSTDNVVNLEDDVAAVAFSGTTTGVEDGQTVTLDIGGIQATAVVSSDAFSGTADLSSLADGTTLPVQVDVMDVAGNAAPTFSGSIDKDTSAPSINSLVVSIDDVVNLEDDTAAVAFSGTTTGVEDGQTVTVNIAGQSVLVAVSDNAFSGTVDLTAQADGAALAVQADVSDASGNAAPTFSGSIDKDTSAPSINSLVVSTDNVVNLEDDVAAVAFSGTTTGVEDGQTVTLDIGGIQATAVVSSDAFSGTADLSSLADGTTLPVHVDVMDVAGNAAPTFSGSIDKDTSAPSINSLVVSIDDVVNLEDDAAAVAFSGTTTGVEDGQTVTVNIAGQSVLVAVSDNAFSGTVDLTGVSDGAALAVQADVSDASGNAAPTFSVSIDKDTSAPSINSLVVSIDDVVNLEDDVAAVAFSGTTTGVEDGQTMTLDIGGIPVTALVFSNAFSGTADLSSLADGTTLPVQVDVMDVAGNAAPTFNSTISKDTSAPSINSFVVSIDDVVNLEDDAAAVAFSGTTTGVEDGQTVTLDIAGQSVLVTVSDNAFSGTVDLSRVNGSGLRIIGEVKDVAGNAAPVFTHYFDKDTVAPTIATLEVSTDNVVNLEDDVAAVAFSGTTTGVEDGQTVTLDIGGIQATAVVSSDAFSGTADLSSLADGTTLPVQVDVMDVAGNAAPTFSGSIDKDTSAPSINSLVVSTDDVVNLEDDTAAVAFSGTTTGVEDGQTVTVNIAGQSVLVAVSDNAFSGTVDLTAQADGAALAVQADVSDASGNAAPTFSGSIDKDTSAPSINSLVVSTDNVVNLEDDVAAVAFSGTTTGVEDGQTVILDIAGQSVLVAVSDNAFSGTADLSSLADGTTLPVQVDVMDVAGNAAPTFNSTISKDTSAPSINSFVVSIDDVVNLEDDAAAVAFSGTTTGVEDGQTVTLDIAGQSALVAVSDNAFSGTVNLTGVSDGSALAVQADVSDALGNAAPTFTSTIVKDTAAPTITELKISDDGNIRPGDDVTAVTFSGTTTGVDDGQTLTLDIGGITVTALVFSNAFSGTADLSTLADGASIPVNVEVTDRAGNKATQSDTISKSGTVPTIEGVAVSDNNIVNLEDPEDKVTFNGTTSNVEDGQTVTLDIEGVEVTAVVSGDAFSGTVNLTGVSDGKDLAVEASVSDALGNAAPTFTSTFVKDRAAPTVETIKVSGDNVIDNTDTNLNSVTFSGTTTGVDDGQTVTLDIGGILAQAEVNSNAFSGNVNLSTLADGVDIPTQARVSDAAGNEATGTGKFTKGTTTPSIDDLTISGDNIVNLSDPESAVTFNGTTSNVENGQTVTVNIAGQSVLVAVSDNAFSGTVNLTGLTGTNLAFTANVSDVAGNAATEFGGEFVKDTTAPSIDRVSVSTDDIIDSGDSTNLTNVTFDGTTTGVDDGQTVTLDIGGIPVTALVFSNAFSGTANLSTLADGTAIPVKADVQDAAGNAAPTFNSTIDKDTTAPSIDRVVVSTDNVVNMSDTLLIVNFSGVTTGVDDGQTVTVNIAGQSALVAVSDNAFSGTVDLTTEVDGAALAVQADVSDALGNVAPTFNSTFVKDTAAPSIVSVKVSTDGVIDSKDTNLTSVTFEGTTTGVDEGQTVTLDIGGITVTALVFSNTFSGTADLSTLADGKAISVKADVQDAAGNAAPSFNGTISKDTTAPSIDSVVVSSDNVVSSSDVAAVAFSGTTTGVEDGQTVTVNIAGQSVLVAVSDNAFSGTVDLTAESDGAALAVQADVSDASGYAAPTFNSTIVKDTAAPTIATLQISGDGNIGVTDTVTAVPFEGTTTGVDDGQTLTLDIGGITVTALVFSNAFSGTADLSTLADGASIPVNVEVTDRAGNKATQSDTISKGTTTPSIDDLTVSDNNIVNLEDPEDKVTFNGTTSNVEDGQTVTLDIEGVEVTAVVSGDAFSGTVNLTGVSDGKDLAVEANVSDALGNAAPTFTSTFVKDRAAPTVETIKVSGDNVIDNTDTNLNSVTFSGTTTGVDDGQTVTLDIGGILVQAEVNSNAFSGNVNLSTLADGVDIPTQARVSDAAGNEATGTGKFTKGTTTPSIDDLTISGDNIVNLSDPESAVTFNGTTSNVENGQTVTVNIAGQSVLVAVSDNAFSGTVNLTGLTGTNLAFTANVSDVAGNAATEFGGEFVKDTTAPSIDRVSVSTDDIIDSGDSTNLTNVTFDGTTTGVDDGQTVTLDIGGIPVTALVFSNAFSGTANLSTLADGTAIPVKADVQDAAGNAAPTFNSTIDKDTTAPSIDRVVVSTDNVVNMSDTLLIVNFSGVTTGVDDGQTVTVNIAGQSALVAVSDNAFSGTVDLTTEVDGAALAVQADVSDALGNVAPTFNSTFVKDTAAPSIVSVKVSTDGVIDSKDTNLTSVTFEGTTTGVDEGQTVTLDIGGITVTALVFSNTFSGTADLSTLADGKAISVKADVQDAAGNAAPSFNGTISKDTTAPSIDSVVVSSDNVVSSSDVAAVAFSGTTTGVEDGQTVTVNIAGQSVLVAVSDNAFSGTVDLTAESDGAALAVQADVSDASGYAAPTFNSTIVKDTAAPTIATLQISGDGNIGVTDTVTAVPFEGTTTGVEEGQTVTLDIGGITVTALVFSNAFSGTADLSTLADGASIPVNVEVTDRAGNKATQSDTISKGTTTPSIDDLTVSDNNIVNLEDPEDKVTFNGTTSNVEDGQTVTLDIEGVEVTAVVSGDAFSGTVNLTGVSDGKDLAVQADVSDALGNAAPTFTSTFVKDRAAPTVETIKVSGDNVIDNTDTNLNSVTFSGTTTGVDDGQMVTLDIGGILMQAEVNSNAFSGNVNLSTLADGVDIPTQARVSDAAGNEATGTGKFTKGTTTPSIDDLTISGDNIVNLSDPESAVTFNGTTSNVENGQTVTVNIAGQSVLVAVSDNAFSGTVNLTGLTGTNLAFTANVSDVAGNAATEFGGEFVKDTTAPSIDRVSVSTDDIIDSGDSTNLTNVTFDGTTTGVDDGQTVTLDIGGIPVTALVFSNAFSGTANLSTLADGTAIPVKADVQDAAGNAAPTFNSTIDKDTTAPSIDRVVVSTDNVVNMSDTLLIVNFSGVTTGVDDGQTVTVNIAGQSALVAVSDNAFSGTVDLTTEVDGAALAVQADVNDALGNVAPTFNSTFVKDTAAPSIVSVKVSTDGVIDSKDTNLTSVTFEGTTTGVDEGQTVTLDIGGITVTALVFSNTFSGTADLSTLADGKAISVKADVQDAAGNAAPSFNGTISKDTTAPSIDSVVVSSDNVVSSSDVAAVAFSGTTTGVEDGQTVTVNIAGQSVLVAVSDNAFSGTVDLTAESDGAALAVQADVSDASGYAAPTFNSTIVKDTAAPTIATLQISGDGIIGATDTLTAVPFEGTTTGVEEGQTVTLDIGGITVTALVFSNAFSGTADLSTLADGASISVNVEVTDRAGNKATQSDTISKGSTVPTIEGVTVSGDNIVNLSDSESAVTFNGTTRNVENGQTVTVNIAGQSVLVAVSDNAFSGTVDLTTQSDGAALAVQADVSDASGNAAPTFTSTFVKDRAAPTVETIKVSGDNVIDNTDTNLNSVTFSGTTTGVDNGQTVTLDIGGILVQAEVNSNAFSGNVNLSTLADGVDIPTQARVSDAAGNEATGTGKFTKGTTTPSIDDLTISGDNIVNLSDPESAVTFNGTTSNVENGQTVTVNIAGQSVLVAVSDNAFSGTVNLTGLTGTNLAFTANVSDVAGNAATEFGGEFVKDTTAPSIDRVSVSTDDIIDSGDSTNLTNVTFDGTTTGVDDGQTVTLDIGGIPVTALVFSNAFSGTANLSTLADGTAIPVKADVQDAAGNAAPTFNSTIDKDTTAPSIDRVVVSTDNVVNMSDTLLIVNFSGVTTGVDDGQTVTVNIAGQSALVAVSDNAFSGTVDLTTEVDGAALAVQADVSDALGNVAPTFNSTFVKDTAAPSIVSVKVSTDGVIDSKDTNLTSVTFEGTTTGVDEGQTVTLDIGGITVTALVFSNTFSGTADLSTLADGKAISVKADVQDAAGNAAPSFNGTISKDTTAPSIDSVVVSSDNVVSSSDVAAVAFSGTTTGVEDGQTVTVNIAGQSVLVAVSDNAFSGTVDLTAESDGAALAVQADVSDASGYAAPTFNSTIVKDTAAPTIATLQISGDGNIGVTDTVTAVPFEGTTTGVDDGQTLTLDIGGITVTALVFSNAFSGTADLSTLADGASIPVNVEVTDRAGNKATQSATIPDTISKGSTVPTIEGVTVSGDNIVNLSDSESAVTFNGTTRNVENGQTVTVNIAGQSVLVAVSDNAFSGTVDLTTQSDGAALAVQADVSDASGNAAPTFTSTFVKDRAAPTVETIKVSGDNVIDNTDTNLNSVTFSGTTTGVDDGQTVTLDIGGILAQAEVNSNAFSGNVNLSTLADGVDIPTQARVSDAAGNEATGTGKFTKGTTTPSIDDLTISGDNIVNLSDPESAVTFNGTTRNVENGQTVTVNIAGQSVLVAVSDNAFSGTVDLTGLTGTNLPFTANVSDVAGNAATTFGGEFVKDTTAPSIDRVSVSTDDIIDSGDSTNLTNVTFDGTTTGVDDGQTVTLDIGGIPVTALVFSNAFSGTANLSTLADGTAIPVKADVQDAAGNAAPTFNSTIDKDTTAPSIDRVVVSTDNVVNMSDTLLIVNFSGVTTGVDDGQTVTVNIAGQSALVAVSDNAFSGTVDLTTEVDGAALAVQADVSDALGNVAPTFNSTFVKDTAAPSIVSVKVSTDGVIDSKDTNLTSVTFEGTTTGVDEGQTVTLDIGGITVTALVFSNTFSGTADLSTLADGKAISVKADVQDAAGNAAPSFNGTISKDTTAPSIDSVVVSSDNVVSSSDVAAVAFSGTTTGVEDGQTVTVNIAGQSVLVAVSDNAFSGTVDLTAESDGAALAVQADVSDASGYAAPTFNSTIVKDTAAPTIATLQISGDGNIGVTDTVTAVPFEGTTTGVDDGQTLTLDIGGITVTALVFSNAFSGTVDLSTLADGASIPVNVEVTDRAGNKATQSATIPDTISKGSTVPTIEGVTVSGDNIVNLSDSESAVTFNGTTRNVENGQTVTVNIAGQSVLVAVSDNAFSGTVDLTTQSDGAALAVQADVSDASGNAAPTFTSTFVKDRAAPTVETIKVSGDNVIDNTDTNLNSVTFSGTTTGVDDGQTVTLDIGGILAQAEVNSNAFSGNVNLSTLADGVDIPTQARVSDAAGNEATGTGKFTKGTTTPSIDDLTISGDNIVNLSDPESAVTFNGTTSNVENGQTVTVNIAGQSVLVAVSDNAFSGTVDLTGLTGTNLPFTANVSDVAGNAATEFGGEFVKDTTAPSIDRVSVSTDDIIDSGDSTNLTNVTFDGTTTGVEVGQTVTVSIGGLLYYALVEADGTFEGTADVSLLKDNNALPVEASVSDQAGNPASPVSKTIVKDVDTPPQLFILDDDADNIFLPSESATITFQFSEPVQGFTDSDIVVTGGNLTALSAETVNPDGTVEYTATLSPLASTAESDGVISISVADNTFIDLNLLNGRGATERYELQTQVTVPTGASVSEANSFGAEIGALTFDGSGDAKLGYTWVVSDSRFEVVGDKLMLKAGQSLDFDTEPSITFDVTLSNSGYKEETQSVTVSVTDASTTKITEIVSFSESQVSTTSNVSPPINTALHGMGGGYFTVWYENGTLAPAGQLSGQYFDEDGNTSGSVISIGTTGVSGRDGLDVDTVTAVTLTNNNVLITWVGDNDNLQGVIVDTELKTAGPEFDIADTGSVLSGPVTQPLNDGGFAVAYYSNASGGNVTARPYLAIFDSEGVLLQNEEITALDFPHGSDGFDLPPLSLNQLNASGNHNIVVSEVGVSQVVQFQVFNYDASTDTLIAESGRVVVDNVSNAGPPVTQELSNGNFIISFYGRAGSDDAGSLVYEVYASDGTQVPINGTTNFVLAGMNAVQGSDEGDLPYVNIVELSNGDIVISQVSRSNHVVEFAVIDGDTYDPSPRVVVEEVGTQPSPPLTIALSNGGFFITWYDGGFNNNTSGVLRGQYFNADGSLNGEEMELSISGVNKNNSYDVPIVSAVEIDDMSSVVVSWKLSGVASQTGQVIVTPPFTYQVFDDISGGETIATLSFVDIATTSTYQWELSDTRFEVVGNELKLKVGETLDYISDSTINLSVTLQTDIYENPTQVITIQVKDRINYVAEGSTGVDTIVGTTDDDWIYGNQGNDILTGGASRDVFVYKGLDGSDTITDFDASVGGDQVDLRELLSFNPGDTLSNFISFNNDGTNITLKIDSDGGNNFVSPDVEIYLDNYITSIASPLTLDDLENNNFIL